MSHLKVVNETQGNRLPVVMGLWARPVVSSCLLEFYRNVNGGPKTKVSHLE